MFQFLLMVYALMMLLGATPQTMCACSPCWTSGITIEPRTISELQLHLAKKYKPGADIAVIFDIDDTCIRWSPRVENYVAIDRVQNFYHWVKEKKWHVFFLTGRWQTRDQIYADAQKIAAENLVTAGYSDVDHEMIICRTYDDLKTHARLAQTLGYANDTILTAQWKAEKRHHIARTHNVTVVATLDDRRENLTGEHVGTPIHIELTLQ